MCSEYSLTAEQISQRSDKHSLKVMVTSVDCTPNAKSQYTHLKVTFVTFRIDASVYSVKNSFSEK